MSSIAYPNTVAPAAERRTFTIAFVGLLHLAVIYTILVALNIAPSPLAAIPGVKVLPTKVVDQPPAQPPPTVVLAHPDPGTVVKPDFPIDNTPPDDGGGKLTPHEGTGSGAGLGDVFEGPVAVASTHTIPPYPSLDTRLGHEGQVTLVISLDAGGAIAGATVVKSSGYDSLDDAAVAWVKSHWRYKPATKGGVAVPSTTRATVVFHLTVGRG
ncbi:MAG TPA: energy transducer TonB [Rhizomicrobium sp.]|jgi:protein TonB